MRSSGEIIARRFLSVCIMFEISRRICCRTFCTRLGCARATTRRRGLGAPAARARARAVTVVARARRAFARRDARDRAVTDDERRAAETDARAVDGVGVENMTNGDGRRRVTRVRDAREERGRLARVVDDRRIDRARW